MYSTLLKYLACLSVMSSVVTATAHSNLRRRSDQEVVTCPCVDATMDEKLINSASLEIDLHRTRSCVSSSPENMERIYWTPIDPADRPTGNIVRPIDGVKYNYLKVIYSPADEYYSCTRNDIRDDSLTKEQAEACMSVVRTTCDEVKPQLCDLDVTFMESLKSSINEGDVILDQDMSCKEPSSDEEGKYSIYKKVQGADPDAKPESEEVSDKVEGTHCRNLIASTCSGLQLTRDEDSQCSDDPTFRLRGNPIEEEFEAVKDFITGTSHTVKNCEWVAEDLSRCRKKSDSGQRAFEACRKTCGYCSCSDDESYLFNTNPGQGCAWVGEDTAERCSLEGASEHCKATCGTKCCQDKPNFRFMKEENKSCGWAAKNKTARCAKKAVAANCPETCGLCPSS